MLKIKKVCVLLVCSLFLTACSSETPAFSEIPAPSAANYKTTVVERGSFQLSQKSGGSFVYPVTYTVSCEYEHAILKEAIGIHRGSDVKKGDVLATFTFDVSKAELEKMELIYQQTLNAVEEKKRQYRQEIQRYAADGTDEIADHISALQKEQAENELGLYELSSAQELEQSKKELENYKALFSEKTLIAPCDGTVSSVTALVPGKEIPNGTAVCTIYSPDTVYFKLSSASKDFLKLAALQLPVTITSGKWSSTGEIASTPTGIDEVLDNQDIYISIDHPQDIPQIGSPGTECVVLKLEDMLLLPRNAIHTDASVDYVFILEDGVSQKRNILCGPENNDKICILDGLAEGQQIILN